MQGDPFTPLIEGRGIKGVCGAPKGVRPTILRTGLGHSIMSRMRHPYSKKREVLLLGTPLTGAKNQYEEAHMPAMGVL